MTQLKTFTYGSVCSGIEAASAAWRCIGEPLWFSEIEPFPCRLLSAKYPSTPNLGDMRTIAKRIACGEVAAPDVLVGGTPCQSFSITGLRRGLKSDNGKLALSYVKIFTNIQERKEDATCIWENVPGVLSDRENAFGCFISALSGEPVEIKPPTKNGRTVAWPTGGFIDGAVNRVAWRVLDSQYFGVPQRRRRVYVVASSRRSAIDPRRVLFDREAYSDKVVRARAGQGGGFRTSTVGCCGDGNKRGVSIVHGSWWKHGTATEEAKSRKWRRLTVAEELARQGFDKDYLDIVSCGKLAKYKAIGNSMTPPVMRWLGVRLNACR